MHPGWLSKQKGQTGRQKWGGWNHVSLKVRVLHPLHHPRLRCPCLKVMRADLLMEDFSHRQDRRLFEDQGFMWCVLDIQCLVVIFLSSFTKVAGVHWLPQKALTDEMLLAGGDLAVLLSGGWRITLAAIRLQSTCVWECTCTRTRLTALLYTGN